jgi:CheY-like chemotaxis protein/HPt (histidine-containing phosphotransfer) domain-containing protein
LMKGTMWVESTEGQWATFHFTILAPAAPAPARAFLYGLHPYLIGRHLLIVDDNATSRQILQFHAESWGMVCCSVPVPNETPVQVCRQEPFDVALLDMQTPGLEGLTWVSSLREAQAGHDLSLIMLTSLVGLDEQQRQAAADVSVTATLTKPVKPSQLYETLQDIFVEQPIHVQQQTSAPVSEFDPQMGQQLPLNILLVDDNSTNQKLGLRLLQRLGYRADVAANGAEAVQAQKRQEYDVLLMDMQMPVMDGLEATRQIRGMATAVTQPYIIAMTANALEEDREACTRAGMDDYVSKPIRVAALVEALKRSPSAKNKAAQPMPTTLDITPPPPTNPAADETTPVLDPAALAQLLEIIGGEPAYLHELIDSFLEDAPQLIADIEQGMAHGDATAVRLAAHSLKANAADFGAMQLRDDCATLENVAKNESLAEAVDLVSTIAAEFARVIDALMIERGK